MTLGGILILLAMLVSVIVFIYLLVVSAKTWGVLHSILLSTLFIECWVFMAFSAGVQYNRVRATKQAYDAKLKAENALAETERLLWGKFDVENINLEAVVPVKGQLRRMTADRGRVWRNVNFVQADGAAYQLEVSSANAAINLDPLADQADAAAPAPTSDSLPVDLVVYAFSEEVNEEGRPIPNYYLGEFSVTQSQAGTVTLEPTLELFPQQKQFIDAGTAASWTLYELLPQDSHTAFAAPSSVATDEAIFGRMDEEVIAGLFSTVPEADGRQQKTIQQYVRDGQRANDTDPQASVWVQVNLLKDYEIDVDSKEVANATERGYFDLIGRSLDSRLKRDDDGRVKLSPNLTKRLVLKEEAARTLIDNGTAELVQRIYVRPLVDYEEGFNKLFVRLHETGESIKLFMRDTSEMDRANQLAQEMISFRQVENQKLVSDLQNYQKELAVLNDEVAQATSDLSSLKAAMGQLYRSIQARSGQFTAIGG